jgi:hypothetical protein
MISHATFDQTWVCVSARGAMGKIPRDGTRCGSESAPVGQCEGVGDGPCAVSCSGGPGRDFPS